MYISLPMSNQGGGDIMKYLICLLTIIAFLTAIIISLIKLIQNLNRLFKEIDEFKKTLQKIKNHPNGGSGDSSN
ncbi:TPA: hypothetical protein KQC49_002584 [Clostridioides difficile]|nr:hypothetical protein [Clostridioides difficile]